MNRHFRLLPLILPLGILWTLVALVAAGCGGTTSAVPNAPNDAGASSVDGVDGAAAVEGGARSDGGPSAEDASAALDAGAFCSGSSPRLQINGADAPVLSLKGKAFALNCCDSAELTVATGAFQTLINLLWRAPAAGAPLIDLSSPGAGFSLEMDLGCDPAVTTCGAGTEERYTTGFQGTINHTTDSTGMDASYCISVAEAAGSPHSVIHSLQLYAPHVASSF